jgi:hypothetical protein
MSFVGAPNSPLGNSINFHGINAPDQFDTKMKRKIVPRYGTHLR